MRGARGESGAMGRERESGGDISRGERARAALTINHDKKRKRRRQFPATYASTCAFWAEDAVHA